MPQKELQAASSSTQAFAIACSASDERSSSLIVPSDMNILVNIIALHREHKWHSVCTQGLCEVSLGPCPFRGPGQAVRSGKTREMCQWDQASFLWPAFFYGVCSVPCLWVEMPTMPLPPLPAEEQGPPTASAKQLAKSLSPSFYQGCLGQGFAPTEQV